MMRTPGYRGSASRAAAAIEAAATAPGEDQQLPTTFLGLRLWVEQEVQAHVKLAMRELQASAAASVSPSLPGWSPSPARDCDAGVGEPSSRGDDGLVEELAELSELQRRQAAELRELREALNRRPAAPSGRHAESSSMSAAAAAAERATERVHALNLNTADQAKRLRRVSDDVASLSESFDKLRSEVHSATSAGSIASARRAVEIGASENWAADLRTELLREASDFVSQRCSDVAAEAAAEAAAACREASRSAAAEAASEAAAACREASRRAAETVQAECQAEVGRLWAELRDVRQLLQEMHEPSREHLAGTRPRRPGAPPKVHSYVDEQDVFDSNKSSPLQESPAEDWDSALAAAQARLHGVQDRSHPHFGRGSTHEMGARHAYLEQDAAPDWDAVLSAARSQLHDSKAEAAVEEEELDLALPSPPAAATAGGHGRADEGEPLSGWRDNGGSLRGLAAAALAGRVLMQSARSSSPGSPVGNGESGIGVEEEGQEADSPPAHQRSRGGGLTIAGMAARALAEGVTGRRGGGLRRSRRGGSRTGNASGSESTDGEGVIASAAASKTAAATAAAERRLRRASAVAAAAAAAVGVAGRRRGAAGGLDSPTFGGRFGSVSVGGS